MKIGILGMGSIGSRHAKNFMQLGCGVRAYDPATNPDTAYRKEVVDWADAIVICTPTARHWEDLTTIDKPCFVEKPIVATKKEWTDGPYPWVRMVGYNLRFHSCVIQTRKWLGAGFLGKPIWARFTCAQYNGKSAYLRDGVILNWSHEIDLAIYLLGEVAEVLDCITPGECFDEDQADITLMHLGDRTTPDGALRPIINTIHLDYLTNPERRGFEIICEKGSIEVDLVARVATTKGQNICDVTFHGKDSFDDNYISEAQAFLDRLDGKDVLGATAEEALNVVDICLTAKEMARG